MDDPNTITAAQAILDRSMKLCFGSSSGEGPFLYKRGRLTLALSLLAHERYRLFISHERDKVFDARGSLASGRSKVSDFHRGSWERDLFIDA